MFRTYNPVIHYDLGAVPTRGGVIPVLDTGIYLIFIMDIILTYVPRICCPLHNLRIFLYLDPSVSYSDDIIGGTGMTKGSDE
ncbi:hypothetical protein [Wolbachia endosymbiont (group A) of Gymnosoma rotundatum]|uniref:hypothetical protein n=1 Tax=Wolbachia endosymbiont (group A) of Gymnosoma rotundatum TaxID=2954016 RepID=UPI0022276CFE|nr:hypothetical protein [Wolbachia endosymbiont (group A) of Gymnosoma rotundatum]